MIGKMLTLFLVILTTLLSEVMSCQPCQNTVCDTDVSKCKDGVVKDNCGCCKVCARGEGETCGGLFYNHGKCGEGLHCVRRRPNSVKILGENDIVSGVCEREECKNKVCGFNQRCRVNHRGKARCVCPKYCKNRYMPVCGEKNGRHYWNRCYLRKDECKSQQRIGYIEGACKSCEDNGKSYRFGETITRKDECEKCVCKHGKWECEVDPECQIKIGGVPEFCDVHQNNCPEGFYCQGGKYEPPISVVDIGIGFCIPLDEERPTEDAEESSGDDGCPKLNCEHCRHGYVTTLQGCATCECIKGTNFKSVKNVCDQPKDPGPCMANQKRFYYNKKKGRCLRFTFGGCLSNGNNFATKKKCEKKCMK
ncbi:agrin-like [Dendronephthya gigantea]|uniref:agrin-like n=1 Tax=Dendronephthya gigantea TaxID=151771 RepID=UPI00106BB01F|nr:agrin-like [Dendronephthya gigantea]XP_028409170.1 agrin-like [Dendronephthya gigantea]XP_028409171.1 agrin-like [Dendronephthya gigantea]